MQREMASIRMIAKMPTIAAMAYKYSIGQPFIYPRNELEYSANFLHMCFAVPCEEYKVDPDPRARHATASSSCMPTTSRTPRPRRCGLPARPAPIRSPASRPASPVCGVPAHGGANEAALQMLQEIGTVDRIPEFIKRAKDKNDSFRLMGFGHRVYKNYDPRAKIMQKTCHEVLDAVGHGDDPILESCDGARADRALRRLFHPEEALSQYRLLLRHHAEGARLPDRHVHGAVRHRAHGRLDRPVEGDDRGSAAAHRQAAPALYRSDRAQLRADATRARRRRSSVSRSPTRKSPCRLAAAMVAARSAINTRPAATAMPARPAAAALFTVSGPMVGRSTRSSCPGFGALTRTPASGALFDPADFAQLGAAGEHGVGPFGGLHGKHIALGHDGRLADIEAAERADHAECRCRYRPGPRRRAPCRRASPLPPEAQAPRRPRHAPGSPCSRRSGRRATARGRRRRCRG